MSTKKHIWVLTKEINAYDQEGAYFVAAFEGKPDYAQLANVLKTQAGIAHQNVMEGIAFLDHLLKGGGRQGLEDTWFLLEQVELQ